MGKVNTMLSVTRRLDRTAQEAIRGSVAPKRSSRNAVMLPLDTSPNARTPRPAIPARRSVTNAMLHPKADLNRSVGCRIEDSTGRMMQIPSKLYRIPQRAMGASFVPSFGRIGSSPHAGRSSQTAKPIHPSAANPASISTVPRTMRVDRLRTVGREHDNPRKTGRQRVVAAFPPRFPRFQNARVARMFSPTKPRKTVQMASCWAQMHTATKTWNRTP
mmetsp:Transcript_21069/g.49986  ORF Transcript_21069/g.49986 Transcript_21069/m.49986 type:complete len:217 (+) Transcript_21069:1219-1869(+)